jgi:hypothetical protein
MTGENFKSLNRSGNTDLKNKLCAAKEKFTQHIKKCGEENWSSDLLNALESNIEKIEYEVWCEEYEDNRRRNWR